MKSIAEFEVLWRQYLDSTANLIISPPSGSSSSELLLRAYKNMVLVRTFDAKAVALQRTGQMGTYPSSLGQEAVGTGIGLALREEDVFVPYYRDQATQILRGIPPSKILQYWGGDERGSDFPVASQDFPNCVPVATQLSHAAGVATAIKLKHEKRVVVATCGDGATSRGDFYETLNVAGVWQLPLVIVINNNQWAISVRRAFQSGTKTLAQKSIAAGVSGEVVDGNDVMAVHAAVSEALNKARAGKGATLIEAKTYRLCDHTTADDANRYQSAEELKSAWQNEPIKRLQTYLHQREIWDEKKETELQKDVKAKVEQAVSEYIAFPAPVPDAMFEHVFEKWPAAYEWQRQALKSRIQNRQQETK